MAVTTLTERFTTDSWRGPSAERVAVCELCGGDRFRLISRHDRKGQPLDTKACLDCGLVSHRQIPSEAEMAFFYARLYRRAYHGEILPSNRRVMRAWRGGRRILSRVGEFARTSDRILEVGSGIGCSVKQLQLAGYPAEGIEPDQGFQRYSRAFLHAPVKRASLYDLPPLPRYDLVLLVHVIEHFCSPRRALETIARLLRPGGRVYVECPNLAAPFARPDRLFHKAHIFNFNPATLTGLAARAGFELERTFSDVDTPNLQMLFRHTGKISEEIDPQGYSMTLRGLQRYNKWTYHLRSSYLSERLFKIGRYAHESLFAARSVREIIARCQTHTPDTSLPSPGNQAVA